MSKPMKKFYLLAMLFIVATVTGACSSQPAGSEAVQAEVKVAVTKDFGHELMFEKTARVAPGTSAMAALQTVAEVETEYGGGFVNAINGVKSTFSGKSAGQADWFVYINGMLSNAGALEYKIGEGDIMHWDYHDWGSRNFLPAVVGDFPEPFRHGYAGKTPQTIIVYTGELENEAGKLAQSLAKTGVGDVTAKSHAALSEKEKESSNIILMGTKDDDFIIELNRVWKRLGFFAYFKDNTLVTVDSKGEVAATYGGGAGLIQATQNPWNPKGIGACENVAWMISGTDEAGTRNAVDAMIKHSSELRYAYGIIVNGDEIIRIPAGSGR